MKRLMNSYGGEWELGVMVDLGEESIKRRVLVAVVLLLNSVNTCRN
jgi:hypothetical protein